MIARTLTRYQELCATREIFSNRALNLHLKRFALPNLALYQVLREEGQDREAALMTVERLFVAVTRSTRKQLALLGRLPIFFRCLHVAMPWITKFLFPAVGWETEWIENNNDCIAFNMRSCFYVDQMNRYGAPELMPIFCLGDDVLFDNVSPYMSWERTQTMGRGNTHCDFRLCRIARARGIQAPH